jgi:hypothetical protein
MSKPKRTATATIEGQVNRARDLLHDVGPAFDRPREISNGILCVINVCDVFIRIIENQQFQIEQLQDQVESLEERMTSER